MEVELQSCYLHPGLEKLDRGILEHNMMDESELLQSRGNLQLPTLITACSMAI